MWKAWTRTTTTATAIVTIACSMRQFRNSLLSFRQPTTHTQIESCCGCVFILLPFYCYDHHSFTFQLYLYVHRKNKKHTQKHFSRTHFLYFFGRLHICRIVQGDVYVMVFRHRNDGKDVNCRGGRGSSRLRPKWQLAICVKSVKMMIQSAPCSTIFHVELTENMYTFSFSLSLRKCVLFVIVWLKCIWFFCLYFGVLFMFSPLVVMLCAFIHMPHAEKQKNCLHKMVVVCISFPMQYDIFVSLEYSFFLHITIFCFVRLLLLMTLRFLYNTELMLILIISSICSNWAPRLTFMFYCILNSYPLQSTLAIPSISHPLCIPSFFVCCLPVHIFVICECFVVYIKYMYTNHNI